MRFKRSGSPGSNYAPEVVCVGRSETPSRYLDAPQPVNIQELPGYEGPSFYQQQQEPKYQTIAGQHDSLMGQSYSPARTRSEYDNSNRRHRICGMPPWLFVLALLVTLLIIVGAVLGGILGSRSMKGNKVVGSLTSTATPIPAGPETASSTLAVTSTISGPGTTVTSTVISTIGSVPVTSATSKPSSTTQSSSKSSTMTSVTIRPTASARFAGLAVGSVGNSNMKLFYVDKQKNAIVGHSHGRGSSWEDHGSLSGLTYTPSMSNSVAVAYWLNSGNEEIRVYYISQDAKLIELSLTCPVNSTCTINGQQALGANDIADTSNISVVQYFNAQGQPRIIVYYINKSNQLSRLVYNSKWGSANSTGYSVYPGSSVATTMVDSSNYGHKTYYTTTNRTLSSIYSYEDNRPLSQFDVLYAINASVSTSDVDQTANIAACDVPSTTSNNYKEGRIYRIADDSLPYEVYSMNGAGWTAARSSPPWLKADYGNKDGIAAASWYDTSNVAHVRLYYPNGGSVTEHGSDNWKGWYTGQVFPST